MERIKKYSVGMLVGISAIILLLSVTAAIIINSGALDLLVKNRIIGLFNESYRGRLELKELHLNFPNKVSLIEPKIYEEGSNEPALSAKLIKLKFNFLSLLKPKINSLYFQALNADTFSARIIENEQGRLNLEEIFTPRDPDAPPDIAIEKFRCKRLSLRKCSVLYAWKDKSRPATPAFRNLDIRNITLNVSGFFIQKEQIRGIIDQVQFQIPGQGFTLRKGSAYVLLSKDRSELLSLDLETEKSKAELSFSVDGLNVFSPELRSQVAGSRAFLHVQSLKVHTSDINIFLPGLGIPEGLYSLSCNAKGTLGELEIQKSMLTHEDSKLAVQGKLLNLQEKDRLAFQLQIDSSNISSGLLQKVLKDDRSKDLAKQTGDIGFSGLLQGSINEWFSDIAFQTGIGKGSLALGVKHEPENTYRTNGTFTLEQAELHRLMHLESAASSLNCSGNIDFLTNKLDLQQAHLEAMLINSFWQQQPIASGAVMVDYADKIIDASADLQQGDGAGVKLNGKIDLSSPVPVYEAGGSVSRFDLSKALASKDFTTNLNGTLDLKGKGFDPASLNIGISMLFAPSSINDFRLKDKSKISADIAQYPSSTSITVKSDFLDVTAEGNYSFRDFLDGAQFASGSIRREIGQQDIWHGAAGSALATAQKGQMSDPFTVNYQINVRDITPFVIFLPVKDLSLQGTAAGKAIYAGNMLAIDADVTVSELHSHKTLTMNNSKFIASMQCTPLGVTAASVSGTTTAAAFQGKEFRNLNMKAGYTKGRLDASIDLAIPKLDESVSGSISVLHNGPLYTVTVNKLALSSPDGVWQASEGSQFDVGKTYSRFNNFRIGKENQQIEFDGILSSSQPGSFLCSMSNIELGELKRFALDPSLEVLSGRVNALLSVTGKPGAKNSSLDIKGSSIVYDEMVIGTLHLSAQHNAGQLRFNLESHIPTGNLSGSGTRSINTITGNGTLPLLLTFSPFKLRIPDNRPLQASLHSDDLSAKFLEYVLPFFESAEGIIPTTVRIEGTTPKPDIYLSTKLNDTRITIEPTQVSYLFNGEIQATPSLLELRNLQIRDTLQGTGSISGLVRLSGLEAKSVDLSGKCRTLLLFNKKDKKDETTFGSITGSTDNFRLYGDIKSPTAEGEFRVSDADFNLYRTGSNESAKYIGVEKFVEFVPRYPEQVARNASKTAAVPETPEFYYNLIDILQISNLKLTSSAPLHYNIIFDRIRGEKLETTINNLSLNVNKNQQRYRLFGSVDITGGKYKFSNSNFDLENGGRIAWNNQEIRDGVMQNLYGSKYVTVSDVQSGERDNVKLLLAIGGTLNEPNVRMGYYLNDNLQPYSTSNMIGGQSSQIDPNAELNVISMLLSKQWYVHPDRQGKTANIPVSSVGLSAGTGLLSSQISNVVQNLAGLESFNVNLGVDDNGALSGLELYFALTVPGTDGKVRFIGTGSTPNIRDNALFNYYGTSQKLEYRVTPKLYIEAYRSYGLFGNEASSTNLQKPSETWGVSLSYREKFHNWSKFWNSIFGSSDKKQ